VGKVASIAARSAPGFACPLVVDGGELRVDLAGGVGRADQLLAEPGGAGLGDRLALAVGLAGLRRPGGQPGERLEPTRRPEALRSAHRGDQQRRADLGDAGQAAGQLVGLDLAVGPLAGLLVGLLLAKHRAQKPDLGGQLGSQILVGHDGVVAVQGHRSLGNPQPGTRPSLGLDHGEAARRAGEQHLGDPLRPGLQQRAGVAVLLEHGQVPDTHLAGEHIIQGRIQLAGQVADADLVGGGLLGQPLAGPHPPVQAGPGAAGQLEWLQALGVHQRQPGQGLGVDGVGLGMPRQKPPQISGLGRGHRYTVWPRRPKKTATGSHAGPVGSITTSSRVPAGAPASAAASITANASSVGRVRRRPRTWPVWSRIATVWAVVMPRSMPSSRRSATTPPSRSGDMMLPTARPVATAPRSSSCPATAPTHVESTGPASSWV
jgi:hypothetical protein